MDLQLDELRDKIADCTVKCQEIVETAQADKRETLTEDEATQFDELHAEGERFKAELNRREKLAASTEFLTASTGRKAQAQPIAQPEREDVADKSPVRVKAEWELGTQGRWGWSSFGDYASAVQNASRPGATIDNRLSARMTPTTYGSEAAGSDGGHAIPPDFRNEIASKVMGEDSLMGRTDQLTTSSNSITIPKDETTPWQTSGGVLAYWSGEGNQLTQSKPQLEQETVRLNKLTALVPVTSELLEDAPSLDSYLRRKAPEKMDFKCNLAIVQGTGSGQPQGIINAASTVSVAKEASQDADTVVASNIIKMWMRLYGPCRQNAVWLVNQDVEYELNTMSLPGKDNTGTFVTNYGTVVYQPQGGLSGSPYATLMGRPVIPTQACETLGDSGDIILTDLSKYLTVTKTSGVRAETSIHLWFDYDMTAFRFIFRVGGQPWWTNAITARDGSTTYGCSVKLDERG